MRKHGRRLTTIAACLAFAFLFVVFVGRRPALTRDQYDLLGPDIGEQDIEAILGFAGQQMDGPPMMGLRGKLAGPNPADYSWKSWQGREAEVRVGFDANGGLRCKCWIVPDKARTIRISNEIWFSDDSIDTSSRMVAWTEAGSFFERWRAWLGSLLP